MGAFLVAGLIGCVSLLYATAGQAGGTAFLAIMAFAAFPAGEMRATALLLNIVAAGYATWRLHRHNAIVSATLMPLTLPSLPAALIGGLWVLPGTAYRIVTALLLLAAAALMLVTRTADTATPRPISRLPATAMGAGAGFVSGLTGVGGGVFLTPLLIAGGWAAPRHAAAIAPPFILGNSIVGLLGALLAGQTPAPGLPLYAAGALGGAIIGTAIAQYWMSQRATRMVLAAILAWAALRLLFH